MTSCVGKVAEKLILRRLSYFLSTNGIIRKEQSWFLKTDLQRQSVLFVSKSQWGDTCKSKQELCCNLFWYRAGIWPCLARWSIVKVDWITFAYFFVQMAKQLQDRSFQVIVNGVLSREQPSQLVYHRARFSAHSCLPYLSTTLRYSQANTRTTLYCILLIFGD